MMRTISILSGLLSLVMVACVSSVNPDAANGPPVSKKMEPLPVNQIIIKYKPSAGLDSATAAGAATQMQRLRDAAGITLTYIRPMSGGAHVFRLPQLMEVSRVQEICGRIAALPDVEYAEPDNIMRAIGNPAEGM